MLLLDRRDYRRALDLLAEAEGEGPAIDIQYLYAPISLLRAQALALSGQRAAAKQAYGAAARELEDEVTRAPGDSRVHSALGIACAGLGRPEDALREARRGCELMPLSSDAWLGRNRISDLALVCAMAGRPDEAIAQIEGLMSGCGWFTSHLFRLDPRFDALRADRRYEALLEKYAPKA